MIATHGFYRERVESAGIEFRAVRPDLLDYGDVPTVMRRAMSSRDGSDYVVRQLVLPFVRASYHDLLAASAGADALIGHMLTFSAPLAAETIGIPYIHSVLQPFAMFSSHDPPLYSGHPIAAWSRRLPAPVWKALWSLARASSRSWFRAVSDLRSEIGLGPTRRHPLLDAGSTTLNLALFSPVLAPPQPDWPVPTVATGFPIFDRDQGGRGMPEALSRFLDLGPEPVVFTLGSSGVWDAAAFYDHAVTVSTSLGLRAVLLTGPVPRNVPRSLPPSVVAVEYAPHSELFPRAAAIVHQGGIGTTGQALRAGRPMLIMPFAHDQPDNAARCVRLGIARVIPRRSLDARRLAASLTRLLADPIVRENARRVGGQVRAESGAETAAASIEAALSSHSTHEES